MLIFGMDGQGATQFIELGMAFVLSRASDWNAKFAINAYTVVGTASALLRASA
jgi:hypothetical protein